MDQIRNYPWPGNVRELENSLERAVLFCKESELSRLDLDLKPGTQASEDWNTYKQKILTDAEQTFLKQVLQTYHGDVKQVATAMSITTRAVYGKMKKYGISAGQFR